VRQISLGNTPPSTTSSPTLGKHRVFQALQRDKLLMGGERELSQINVTITMVLGLIAFMTLNWHLALVAVLFGGPVQCAIRILSEDDPDYVKTYLEALVTPHVRKPE
jgi:type IV secretory pathway TrbD component